MALMMRETVGAGASAPLVLVCTVVVVTVGVVVYDEEGVWVCADASAAAAKKAMANDRFFTIILDLGEKEISNRLYGAGWMAECKGQEGRGLW